MKIVTHISRLALVGALAAAPAVRAQTGDAAAPAVAAPDSEIIVTGTRATGITAAESATPIKLVGAEAIGHVGQPNLNQVLTQLVPSFTAETFGGDTANLTLSAALRGLNPNQTLVLVDGKRRHGTANLHVLGSPFQGGAAPDLDFITPASIDHIEVLEDGASAQYGSDAIAGVINIILKKKKGGLFSATGGQYYAGDGKTYSASLNYGLVSDYGFINVTGFYRYHDFTQRGGRDVRFQNPDGSLATSDPILANAFKSIDGYPSPNPVNGDARSHFGVLSYNAGLDVIDGVQFYSFGSLGFRNAAAFENLRPPNRFNSIASPVTGQAAPGPGNGFDYASVNYPQYIFSTSGFHPQEGIREIDGQVAGGIKGSSGNFGWDISSTYGRDRDRISTLNSKNLSLYVEHLTEAFTPLNFNDPVNHQTYNFNDGTFKASEWSNNLDLTYKLGDLGTLAAGAEYRQNTYGISPGEPASYYKTAAQSFAGYTPANSGNYKRHNYAIYADAALNPVTGLKIDGAVRYEHYSDFGSKTTWKATGRYDFSEAAAIRGTIATGFRAPTLAEEHYSGINVAPGYNYLQLPPNSSGALSLGLSPLKPETAKNYSAGVVLRPVSRLTVTADAYQISIKNRIVGSGSIRGYSSTGGTAYNAASVVNPNVLRALLAQAGCNPAANPATCANVDYSLTDLGVQFFTNGVSTRTRGIDVVASYAADLGGAGKATFTLSGNYTKNKITKINPVPASIAAYGQSLLDKQALSYLTSAAPKYKLIGGANWSIGSFTIVARETLYGKATVYYGGEVANEYVKNTVGATGITDLEIDYAIGPNVTLAVGANNLFDKRPPNVKFASDGYPSDGNAVWDEPLSFSPYGYNGGYYYARVSVNF